METFLSFLGHFHQDRFKESQKALYDMKQNLLFVLVVLTLTISGAMGTNNKNAKPGSKGNTKPKSSPTPTAAPSFLCTCAGKPANQTIKIPASNLLDKGTPEPQKAKLDPEQLIKAAGYKSQSHTVTTDDGYILTLFRIPNPGKPVAFLMHGILCTARDFLVQPGKTSLPFMLFDAGYDVWLGNMRGNDYANKHTKLSSQDPNGKYWDYTNDEIIKYDMPNSIDYILNNTKKPDLTVVGFSMGNYVTLGLIALKPEYNCKINQFIGLAPFAYLGNIGLPARAATITGHDGTLGPYKFGVTYGVLKGNMMMSAACNPNAPLGLNADLCAVEVSAICGLDCGEMSPSVLATALWKFPNSISAQCLQQLIDDVNDPNFYNWNKTFKYDVKKVTVPSRLYSGCQDTLVTMPDVERLVENLPCPAEIRYIQSFDHADFIYGRHSKTIYDDIISFLTQKPKQQNSCPARTQQQKQCPKPSGTKSKKAPNQSQSPKKGPTTKSPKKG